MFVVHRSGGRAYDPVLTVDPSLFEADATVWIDMERQREITIDAGGRVQLPSFAHSAILTIRGKE